MYDRIFGIPCAETRGIFEEKLSDLGIGQSKNPRVKTYIFPNLAKQPGSYIWGSYWQFRLKQVLKFSVEIIPVQAEKIGLVLCDTTLLCFYFSYSLLNCVYFIINNLQVHTKAQTASRNTRRDSMLGLLGWVHFLHNDPTDRVPACVGVSLLVPTTAGPHIEGYIYRTLRDP